MEKQEWKKLSKERLKKGHCTVLEKKSYEEIKTKLFAKHPNFVRVSIWDFKRQIIQTINQ